MSNFVDAVETTLAWNPVSCLEISAPHPPFYSNRKRNDAATDFHYRESFVFKGFEEKTHISLFASSRWAPALSSVKVWRQNAELVQQAFTQQFQAHKRQIRTRFFLLG